MEIRNDQDWKQDLPAFREKTAAFYAGELSKDAYKGFSAHTADKGDEIHEK